MKNWLKIILGGIGALIILFVVDFICIFTMNRPLLAIKEDNGDSSVLIYRGLVYDTYNCPEYPTPQIKAKGTKFNCATKKNDIGKIIKLVDKTKELEGFACAQALENFYEDDNHIYSWSCIKNEYMIVKYESGFEEPISTALKNKAITISDLDKFNIKYYKQDK